MRVTESLNVKAKGAWGRLRRPQFSLTPAQPPLAAAPGEGGPLGASPQAPYNSPLSHISKMALPTGFHIEP